MNINKQLNKGDKMKNKLKKIAATLITLAIFSTVATTQASAYSCTGYWIGNIWKYYCM